jgi:MOSC domain-containing protein YiiM
MAHITSINISEKKGTPKDSVDSVVLKVEHGLVGDAHAGPGIRQVSLLSQEDIEAFKNNPKLKVPLRPGIFGENIAVSGLDFRKLKIGTKLKVGSEATIEISKLGKECEVPCMIGKLTGDCIMPRLGVFAIVIKSGKIKANDNIEIIKH